MLDRTTRHLVTLGRGRAVLLLGGGRRDEARVKEVGEGSTRCQLLPPPLRLHQERQVDGVRLDVVRVAGLDSVEELELDRPSFPQRHRVGSPCMSGSADNWADSQTPIHGRPK